MRKYFACFFCMCSLMQLNAFAAGRVPVTKQSVSGGVKIESAGVNTLIDSECSDSYFGCMDAFCVVDNVSGGRCQCSNKHAEISKQLDELLTVDERADMMSQYGGDVIKLGKNADAVSQKIQNVTQKKSDSAGNKKGISRADWDAMFVTDYDDDAEEDFVDLDDIANKSGDALYAAADEMCFEQTPAKCKSDSQMLKQLYVQKIRSDCVAFENSVKQKNSEIKLKLADAQKTLRDAALQESQAANKYGLGTCAKEFGVCMQSSNVCGNNFVGCVASTQGNNQTWVDIDGGFVTTQISAATMDNLLAKRVFCESVLNNCESVRDNVWDAFLRDSAIVLKNSELNVESDFREKCLTSVVDCFAKSCREHFDVNDDAGSYDICLSRPENYKSFCKIELEPCLAATGGTYEKPSSSRLWNGVMAKLSAMRVDACTNEFKQCIQDDDRCGSDYSKCVGLGYYDIVDICPTDKLTACYREYDGKQETVEDTLASIAQGLMLSVESQLYDTCQNAIDNAMLKTCGDTENCNALIVGDGVGAHSLGIQFCEMVDDKYVNCYDKIDDILDKELGKTVRNSDLSKTKNERHLYSGVITGNIIWNQLSVLDDARGIISADEYMQRVADISQMDDKVAQKVKTEVGQIANAIRGAIDAIESDPMVQFCVTGRQVAGLTFDNGQQQIIGSNTGAFPNLMYNVRMTIINDALLAAQENYNKKYDQILEQYVNANATLKQRYAEIDDANYHLDEQDVARRKCMELGEWGAFTPNAVGGTDAKHEIVRDHGNDGNLVGYSSESVFNFKRQVTTNFDMNRMVCTKCTRTQQCRLTKSDYCKKWDEEKEECEEIQY